MNCFGITKTTVLKSKRVVSTPITGKNLILYELLSYKLHKNWSPSWIEFVGETDKTLNGRVETESHFVIRGDYCQI